MADYSFLTTWYFNAPISRVWEEICDTSRWPSWWKGVVDVTKLEEGDASGIGHARRFIWRGALPYHLTFDMKATRIEAPYVLEGVARGELDGIGTWTLKEEQGGTCVEYVWRVKTMKPWMRLLSPIARPMFRWNHDVVMRWGEEGLRARLS